MKSETQRNYQAKIHRTWQYIQNNLDRNLSLEELSEQACISPYHFHRIFRAYTGESLKQYSKRLRLEYAANQLRINNADITSISQSCGYETPAAFSKAFKQLFTISPSEYRADMQKRLSSYQLPDTLHKELTMDYKIIHRAPQRVLYTRRLGDYMQSAPIAWQALDEYAAQHNLYSDKTQMIGLCHDSPEITDTSKIRYDACVPVDSEVQADGDFSIQEIRGGDYAVFHHRGPYETLLETYHKIENEWIANQERELDDAPVFEIYLNPELIETAPEQLETDIYFPIK